MDLTENPCYSSNECDTSFLSGDNVTDPKWGRNPEMCSGILSKCDPTKLRCGQASDPALNTKGARMGCNFGKDADCKEFLRVIDQVTECQGLCWGMGGRKFVDEKCKTLGSEELCNLANYFCEWDGYGCKAHEFDPYTVYKGKYNKEPPKVLVASGGPNCAGTETCIKFPGTATIQCAQSTWSPTVSDSYDPKARVCRIQWDTASGSGDLTIRTPRCQYVPQSDQCSFRKTGSLDIFGCARDIYNYEYTDGTIVQTFKGGGFCTWCQNQSQTPTQRDLRDPMLRLPNEWGPDQRCTKYNECEYEDSEIAYNKCVWQESSGKLGIDPQIVADATPEERKNLLRTKGLCVDPANDTAETKDIVARCDAKTLGQQKLSKDVRNPDSKDDITPAGTSGGRWVHECNKGGGEPYTGNYYCTWCPSLRASDSGDTTEEGLRDWEIALIATGSTVGFIIFVVGIVMLVKYLKNLPFKQ